MATKIEDVIKDTNLIMETKNVKPDYKKGRVVLPKKLVQEGITFRVYYNSDGQIVLDPQVTIPASEAWVFQNKDFINSLDKSMNQSREGRTKNLGSFAEYAKDEI